MNKFDYPNYPPQSGYLTDKILAQYIQQAVKKQLLPANAHRLADVRTLTASNDPSKPIQFWQLYSVLGPQRIVAIVSRFYELVYDDEHWFKSVFTRISTKEHHINSQSAMWIDVMGGGHQYHGGEFRLNFHHTHNAHELMNDRGAERWITLMTKTLDDPDIDFTADRRIRPAINTFLTFFMSKYASEFQFENRSVFGKTNSPLKRRINFLKMTSKAIEALPEQELREELAARRIDISQFTDKQALVSKAQSL